MEYCYTRTAARPVGTHASYPPLANTGSSSTSPRGGRNLTGPQLPIQPLTNHDVIWRPTTQFISPIESPDGSLERCANCVHSVFLVLVRGHSVEMSPRRQINGLPSRRSWPMSLQQRRIDLSGSTEPNVSSTSPCTPSDSFDPCGIFHFSGAFGVRELQAEPMFE